MGPVRRDRRVTRTDRLLQQALMALVLERGYEAVSVQDVLDRADVGRTTFYVHFPNKEALLLSLFDTLRDSLHEALTKLDASQAHRMGEGIGVFEPLFAHAAEHRQLYRALLSSRGGAVLLRYLRGAVAQPLQEHLWTAGVGRKPEASADVALVVAAVVPALLGVLVWWLEEEAPYSPAEMDLMLERLLAHGIPGALAMGHSHPLTPSPVPARREGEHGRSGLAEETATHMALRVHSDSNSGLPSPVATGEGLGVRASP